MRGRRGDVESPRRIDDAQTVTRAEKRKKREGCTDRRNGVSRLRTIQRSRIAVKVTVDVIAQRARMIPQDDSLTRKGDTAHPAIARLGHVGIFVQDVDRSLRFYRDLLGLTVTDADEQTGMYFFSARPESEHHEFLICRGRTAPADVRLLQQVSFRCATLEDVIGFYRRMAAANIRFDRIVSHGNAVGVYFFDPDGNRCEVYWATGFAAKQTYLAPVDLTQEPEAIVASIRDHVERYGATGFVDPALLRNV